MRQLRSELLKLRTTRTSLILFGAMVALMALVIGTHVIAPDAASLAGREQQMKVFEVGTIVGMLFGALFGANAVAAEFRFGTIRPTFLVTPRRWPVIAAKFVVAALMGIVLGVVAEALMTGTASKNSVSSPERSKSSKSHTRRCWCLPRLCEGYKKSQSSSRLLPLKRYFRSNSSCREARKQIIRGESWL